MLKTENVMFKSKQKKFKGDLKIWLWLKSISCWLKMPNIWELKFIKTSPANYVNNVSIKLNRTKALLFKRRKCVNLIKVSRSI